MYSLVDELHMSAGIQRAIETINAAAPPVMCGTQVRLSDFADNHNRTPHTPTAGQQQQQPRYSHGPG